MTDPPFESDLAEVLSADLRDLVELTGLEPHDSTLPVRASDPIENIGEHGESPRIMAVLLKSWKSRIATVKYPSGRSRSRRSLQRPQSP